MVSLSISRRKGTIFVKKFAVVIHITLRLPFAVWTIAPSIKVGPTNCLTDSSPVALASTSVLLRSFHSHSCAKGNLLSALVFLTGYPADALGPWSAERPSHRCAPLPPSRSAKWIYCHCRNFCQLSKGERGDRESGRAMWDFFFLPQMPGHAESLTQRAFEIILLVNSCLMEARRGERLTESEWRHQSSLLSSTEILIFTFLL